MQNKGLIRVFAILFGLVSLYQLSFTYFTNKVEDEAEAYATAKVPTSEEDYVDRRGEVQRQYLDSIGNDPIALGITYNDAKEKELNKDKDKIIKEIKKRSTSVEVLTALKNHHPIANIIFLACFSNISCLISIPFSIFFNLSFIIMFFSFSNCNFNFCFSFFKV